MEKVLNQSVEDVFGHIGYLQSKVVAEEAQHKFLDEIKFKK